MPSISILSILQVILGLGLLNVWLIRAGSATSYRGGSAQTLKAEFAEYGLPEWLFYAIGVLKVGSAIALFAGLWLPGVVVPAAGVVVVLMLGALAMHLKVKDPPVKSLPAFLVLAMGVAIVLLG